MSTKEGSVSFSFSLFSSRDFTTFPKMIGSMHKCVFSKKERKIDVDIIVLIN